MLTFGRNNFAYFTALREEEMVACFKLKLPSLRNYIDVYLFSNSQRNDLADNVDKVFSAEKMKSDKNLR